MKLLAMRQKEVCLNIVKETCYMQDEGKSGSGPTN